MGNLMQPHEQRVVIEKNQLMDKLSKLCDFIESCKIDELEAEDRTLLLEQRAAMSNYLHCLEARIDRF